MSTFSLKQKQNRLQGRFLSVKWHSVTRKGTCNARRSRAQSIEADAAARTGVDGGIEQGLHLRGGVHGHVEREHIIPSTVEEGDFPAAMRAGQRQRTRAGQIAVDDRLGEPGSGQTVAQSGFKERGQIAPRERGHVEAHKGISAVTVDGEQTFASAQVDDVCVPAIPAVGLGAVVGFLFEKTL